MASWSWLKIGLEKKILKVYIYIYIYTTESYVKK
jgi:hypothetical protein